MQSQVLLTVWCHISCEVAGEFWHWSLSGVKGLKEKCISEVARNGCIIISHLSKLRKAKLFILYDAIFWWGCTGNLKLITLGSEKVRFDHWTGTCLGEILFFFLLSDFTVIRLFTANHLQEIKVLSSRIALSVQCQRQASQSKHCNQISRSGLLNCIRPRVTNRVFYIWHWLIAHHHQLLIRVRQFLTRH